MTIVIRCDSSTLLGGGHVSRMISLGKELRRCGREVVYAKKKILCNQERIIREFAQLIEISDELAELEYDKGECNRHMAWEREKQVQDANVLIERCRSEGIVIDAVIVDHYSLSHIWEDQVVKRALECQGKKIPIVVIDDLGNRKHKCSMVVDQNFAYKEGKYASLVDKDTILLEGLDYALLGAEYRAMRMIPKTRTRRKRVLVNFGAADNYGFTRTVVEELSDELYRNCVARVITSETDKNYTAINKIAQRCEWIQLISAAESLAPYLWDSDIAIGASGISTWERACLDVQSICVVAAANQEDIANSWEKSGRTVIVGDKTGLKKGKLRETMVRLINGGLLLETGKELVDGRGCERVAEMISNLVLEKRLELCSATTDTAGGTIIHRFNTHGGNLLCKAHLKGDKDLADVCAVDIEWSTVCEARNREIIYGRLAQGMVNKYKYYKLRRKKCSMVETNHNDLKICIISSGDSWINRYIERLCSKIMASGHAVHWVHTVKEISDGDILLILGFDRIIKTDVLNRFGAAVVVHESDLPKGRGWSPLTWQVLEGKDEIPVCLIEASPDVDSGDIIFRQLIRLQGSELVDDLRKEQGRVTEELCMKYIRGYSEGSLVQTKQTGGWSFYPRRTPEDSEIDVTKTVAEQFQLFRVADNVRYPLWFEYRGVKYTLKVSQKTVKGE